VSLGHSVESTISRSTTSTSSSNTSSNTGTPRQRQNTGRSAMSSGTTTLAGCFARSPQSCTRITSAQTACSPNVKH